MKHIGKTISQIINEIAHPLQASPMIAKSTSDKYNKDKRIILLGRDIYTKGGSILRTDNYIVQLLFDKCISFSKASKKDGLEIIENYRSAE